jgi:shikimate dehydrogenase
MFSSSTQLTGLFGHPVAHSKSPQMHNAAFQQLGLDFAYLAFDVAPERLAAAVESLRALGMRGVNVTIPHKVAVLPLLDEVSEEARVIGAVNTIVNDGGRLIGYNTDGIGYLTALAEETGFQAPGKRVLIVGGGGAARAVAVQLALSGAAAVDVAARRLEQAAELSDLLTPFTRSQGLVLGELCEAMAGYDLVVNTTPVGMYPRVDELPLEVEGLRAGQWVSDLIYNPRETRLLSEAKKRGCTVSGGLGMFVHQGAHAFRLWTGVDAPTDVMRATVESYL